MLKGIALSGKRWGLSISPSFYGKTGNALQSFIPPAGIFDGIAPGQTTLLQQFGYAQRASVAVCVVEFERRLYQFGYSTQAKSRLRPPPGRLCGPPEFCICCCLTDSALPLFTFRAFAPPVAPSLTSTQRPPV